MELCKNGGGGEQQTNLKPLQINEYFTKISSSLIIYQIEIGDGIIEYINKLKASSCKENKYNCILPLWGN